MTSPRPHIPSWYVKQSPGVASATQWYKFSEIQLEYEIVENVVEVLNGVYFIMNMAKVRDVIEHTFYLVKYIALRSIHNAKKP